MRGIQSLLIAGALAACGPAGAATVTVQWDSPVFNPGHVNVGTVTYPGGQNGADAGRFAGTVTGFSGLDAADFVNSTTDFFAYCYDLSQWLTNSTYQVAFGADADVLNFLGAVNSALGGDPFAWLNPGTTNVAAAIQLGIWEGLYENGTWDLTSGNVKYASVPAAVATQYAAFVALLGSTADLDGAYVMRLTSDSTQDVITGRRNPQLQTPEPATVLLIGLGAAAAAFARRRQR